MCIDVSPTIYPTRLVSTVTDSDPRYGLRLAAYLCCDVEYQTEEDGRGADLQGEVDAQAKLQDAGGIDEEERVDVDAEDEPLDVWQVEPGLDRLESPGCGGSSVSYRRRPSCTAGNGEERERRRAVDILIKLDRIATDPIARMTLRTIPTIGSLYRGRGSSRAAMRAEAGGGVVEGAMTESVPLYDQEGGAERVVLRRLGRERGFNACKGEEGGVPGHKARWFNKNRERENAYRERHTMSLAAGALNGHI